MTRLAWPAIKGISIATVHDLAQLSGYTQARAILLDTKVAGQYGGTGTTFDWQVARKAHTFGRPIILAGGLRSPGVLERLLTETKISYFSLCRPFIAEPGLVKRWQAGSQEKVKCLSCNKCLAPGGISCKSITNLPKTRLP
jgi:2,4-dienoyl-CoA reductase-like NADH-dependent reductase (Old Yellow Enzyme family)